MKKKKKIIIGAVSVVAAAAIAVSGILVWKSSDEKLKDSGTVFVNTVEDINTAVSFSLTGQIFSGVVEAQKSFEVKYDSTKVIKEILVKEGDVVEIGTELFTYDVEAMKLEKEQVEIEIERMNNEITSMKDQISELEKEKKSASQDEQFAYTTQIQTLETDIAKQEYDIKVKKTDIEKINKSIENSAVSAEVGGTIAKINSISDSSNNADSYYNDGSQESADVIMTITESGNFRIKGKINEQNMGLIYNDMPVIIKSRIDDTTTWTGVVSEISTEPASDDQSSMYYGGLTDEMTTSSNYNFYITPENIDGLMLGQHVLIEPDYGQTDLVEKSGIWLYSDYILTDSDEKKYVWATDKKDRLEKRYIEIGESDEMTGDCQVISGLSDDDHIAYPSDDYEEGMYTTTDIENADFEEDIDSDINVDEDIFVDDNFVDDNIVGEKDDMAIYEEVPDVEIIDAK